MKFWEPLFNGLGYTVPPILVGSTMWIYHKIQENVKKSKRYDVFKFNIKDEQINDILVEVRTRFNADRSYLSMFHNGTHFVDQSSDLKKSRTHERVSPGVSYEAQNYQDLRVSLMQEETELIRGGEPAYRLWTEIKDGKFKRLLESQGVKAIVRCPITLGQDIIGFLGLDFGEMGKAPENLKDISIYAGRIEQILSRHRE